MWQILFLYMRYEIKRMVSIYLFFISCFSDCIQHCRCYNLQKVHEKLNIIH